MTKNADFAIETSVLIISNLGLEDPDFGINPPIPGSLNTVPIHLILSHLVVLKADMPLCQAREST
jgi:hypothetical protein